MFGLADEAMSHTNVGDLAQFLNFELLNVQKCFANTEVGKSRSQDAVLLSGSGSLVSTGSYGRL